MFYWFASYIEFCHAFSLYCLLIWISCFFFLLSSSQFTFMIPLPLFHRLHNTFLSHSPVSLCFLACVCTQYVCISLTMPVVLFLSFCFARWVSCQFWDHSGCCYCCVGWWWQVGGSHLTFPGMWPGVSSFCSCRHRVTTCVCHDNMWGCTGLRCCLTS